MSEDLLKTNPIVWSDLQAAGDEALAVIGDIASEVELGVADLLVLLEGDVATDHVEEEDAKGPYGGGHAVVARAADPLRWRVDPGSIKLRVRLRLQEGAGAKVDKGQLAGLHVNQDVFILDVTVDDALAVAGEDGGGDLAEEVLGELLLDSSLLRDEVKQVLGVGRLLHDVDEGVGPLEEVEEPDDSADGLDAVQELQLQRNPATVQARPLRHLVPRHVPDGHLPLVLGPDAGIHRPKASLPKNPPNSIGLIKSKFFFANIIFCESIFLRPSQM